jgi:ketosteroid isomerase-like protein
MQRMKILSVGLLIVAIMTGAGTLSAQAETPTPIPEVELPAPYSAVLRAYEAGWIARDADALAALFATDGFIMRPNRPPVRGREAIRRAYANAGGPLILRGYAYEMGDSVGYIIGGFGLQEDGANVGKFILTLRREADKWLITADMDSGNQ